MRVGYGCVVIFKVFRVFLFEFVGYIDNFSLRLCWKSREKLILFILWSVVFDGVIYCIVEVDFFLFKFMNGIK